MTHFKPTVDDYKEIDDDLGEINEKLGKLVEKLSFKFGQQYATMLVKASFQINKTRIGIKDKIKVRHPEVE